MVSIARYKTGVRQPDLQVLQPLAKVPGLVVCSHAEDDQLAPLIRNFKVAGKRRR